MLYIFRCKFSAGGTAEVLVDSVAKTSVHIRNGVVYKEYRNAMPDSIEFLLHRFYTVEAEDERTFLDPVDTWEMLIDQVCEDPVAYRKKRSDALQGSRQLAELTREFANSDPDFYNHPELQKALDDSFPEALHPMSGGHVG